MGAGLPGGGASAVEQGGLAAVIGHPRAALVNEVLLGELSHRGAGPSWSSADAARSLGRCGQAELVEGWSRGERCALVVDGGLVDTPWLTEEVDRAGAVRRSQGPAELLLHLISRSEQTTAVNRLVDALSVARGGWALVWMGEGRVVAARDPNGLRPLAVGREGAATLIASETGPLRSHGASGVRELAPGELLILDEAGAVSIHPFPAGAVSGCAQELLHLSRADSLMGGQALWRARARLGEALATVQPVSAELVVPFDALAAPAASGYARVCGRPLVPALMAQGGAAPGAVAGARVVLVVERVRPARALGEAVAALQRAGATEVHLRCASPPTRARCPYGVSLAPHGADPDRPERLCASTWADSVAWLSARPDSVTSDSRAEPRCDACFSGEFPILARDAGGEQQLPLFQAPPGSGV